ncbi:hypothetical protein QFC24_002142 [Naganishia onofrii]|uniref:Uncharacterized protein n=1 Tax=Naganishia onofrii TaxID=1851511 RepID=A0ACC2XSQ9_9TREE|nr:hypothetical protein QFC24_002142 [Naganishia onofrii]
MGGIGALVHNTPRSTREILLVLIKIINQLLGSDSKEQQGTASRTLGQLCRKNGERILNEIMPILKSSVTSRDVRTREGACLALSEIMQTASDEHLEAHEDAIISAVSVALVDPDVILRMAAARTFDAMQEQIGLRAIDETIPTLLEAMSSPAEASETALMVLKEVMNPALENNPSHNHGLPEQSPLALLAKTAEARSQAMAILRNNPGERFWPRSGPLAVDMPASWM